MILSELHAAHPPPPRPPRPPRPASISVGTAGHQRMSARMLEIDAR